MRYSPGLNGIAQKLRDVIAAHNLPMGQTDEGKDWCIKALHPSDPTTVVRGIPDRSALPSVFMGYQSTQVIESPDVNKPWEADIVLLPSPVCFSAIQSSTTDGVSFNHTNHANVQLAGTTFDQKYSAWKNMAQRWRLAYAAATVYFDAPATANQGTVVVAQYAMRPSLFPPVSVTQVDGDGVPHEGLHRYSRMLSTYTEADWARGPVAQSMPSSYFGNARDGAYIPMKLTETCQDWIGEEQDTQMGGLCLNTPLPSGPKMDGPAFFGPFYSGDTPPYGNPIDVLKFPYWDPALGTTIRQIGNAAIGGLASVENKSLMLDAGILGTLVAGTTVPYLDPNIASVSFRNLDKAARITIFYRYGWELQVQPGSVLTPQQRLSPRHDPVALDAYFAIAREMKDAYPEEYNSFGKIWDVISQVGRTVLPGLFALNPLVGSAAKAVLAAGDALRKRAQKGLETGKNPPSPADAAIATQVIKSSAPRTVTLPLSVIRAGGAGKSQQGKAAARRSRK